MGRPIPGRVVTLFNERLIDWRVLFAVDQNSPYYNENAKMSIFYAQSWALTHMLVTADGYRSSFSRFLAAVAAGDSAEHAFVTVYGKSIKDIDTDLHRYISGRTLKALVFDVKLPKSELDPESEPLPDMQRDLALADLFASQPSKASEAKSLLEALAAQYPQSADVQESLGYLYWQQGDMAQARAHFGSAFNLHSRNPNMMLSYAQMEGAAGVEPAKILLILKQALTLDPANNAIRLELAAAALNDKQYGYAFSTLSDVKSVKQEDTSRFFAIQAFCAANLHQPADAQGYAEKALQYAKTHAERSQLEDLLSYLKREESARQPAGATNLRPAMDSPSAAAAAPDRLTLLRLPGLPRVTGRTKALECVQGGGLRFHLQVEDREMVFALPHPTQTIVRNIPGNAVQWSCGALDGTSRSFTILRPLPRSLAAAS